MHGLGGRFGRYEHGQRRGRSAGRSSALHQRAHCYRRRRSRSAIAGRPFAAPVVVANVWPDAFDHVRLRRHRVDDRPGAPALSPADTAFLGHGFATVVVLASDALMQGDLLDESCDEPHRQCSIIAAKPRVTAAFRAGRNRGVTRRSTGLTRAPAPSLRRNEACCRTPYRDDSISRRRDRPQRPAERIARMLRFDEKKAADRIAVCS